MENGGHFFFITKEREEKGPPSSRNAHKKYTLRKNFPTQVAIIYYIRIVGLAENVVS
jgi:hypothetical protein